MSKYSIAGILTQFDTQSEQLKERCHAYLTDSDKLPDIKISVSQASIAELNAKAPNLTADSCEYLLAGAAFYEAALDFNRIVLHSSAVVLDGSCYAFSAPCGTGKSTHTSLWVKHFGSERAYILNDDKPALSVENGGISAYGTPFSGKTTLNVNASAPLRGICFLERSEKCFIEEMPSKKAVNLFICQTLRSPDILVMDKVLDLIQSVLNKVPVYRFGCDISAQAVRVASDCLCRR